MVKSLRHYTGWGIRGRPFSPKEFDLSYIKKNFKGFKYSEYLKWYAKFYKNKRRRKTL